MGSDTVYHYKSITLAPVSKKPKRYPTLVMGQWQMIYRSLCDMKQVLIVLLTHCIIPASLPLNYATIKMGQLVKSQPAFTNIPSCPPLTDPPSCPLPDHYCSGFLAPQRQTTTTLASQPHKHRPLLLPRLPSTTTSGDSCAMSLITSWINSVLCSTSYQYHVSGDIPTNNNISKKVISNNKPNIDKTNFTPYSHWTRLQVCTHCFNAHNVLMHTVFTLKWPGACSVKQI